MSDRIVKCSLLMRSALHSSKVVEEAGEVDEEGAVPLWAAKSRRVL
jgi:hypothetical protein